jgi:hypothetical protein
LLGHDHDGDEYQREHHAIEHHKALLGGTIDLADFWRV